MKSEDSKADKVAEIKTPASVEKIEIPGEGIRFSVHFSVTIPEGTNNFQELTSVIDEEIMSTRNEIIKKVAKHIGADVSFIN